MNDVEILDVGCGKHKRGTLGIDYKRDSQADVISDAHRLPFRDSTFDKVINITVLEHSPNPLAFLKEQYRVLKPQGKVELVTDNAQYFSWSVFKPGTGGIRHEDYHEDHYMIFFPENVRRLMRLAGFQVDGVRFIRGPRTKTYYSAKLLVKLAIWKEECLYWRFKIVGVKP